MVSREKRRRKATTVSDCRGGIGRRKDEDKKMDEGGEEGMSRKAQVGSLITDFWMRGVSPGKQNEPRHKLGEWQPSPKV